MCNISFSVQQKTKIKDNLYLLFVHTHWLHHLSSLNRNMKKLQQQIRKKNKKTFYLQKSRHLNPARIRNMRKLLRFHFELVYFLECEGGKVTIYLTNNKNKGKSN